MKIKWLGHASFLITSDNGTRIITDPYKTGGDLMYGEVKVPADIVTVSHEHGDHNNTAVIAGNPQIIRGTKLTEAKGIKFSGIATFHDEKQGKERGLNTVFCFEVDGIRFCHLGDIGHMLTEAQIARIGKVDILLTPVGGVWAIDAATAWDIANKLKAKVIIPMHFRNERCDFPVATVDDFLTGKKNVIMADSSEIEFRAGKLPVETQIIVLKPAL